MAPNLFPKWRLWDPKIVKKNADAPYDFYAIVGIVLVQFGHPNGAYLDNKAEPKQDAVHKSACSE